MSVCGDLTGRRRGQNVLNHVQPDLQHLLFLEEVSRLNLRSSRRRSRRASGGGAAGFRLAEGCGLEEAQAVEGRQGYHGFGRGKRWGWRTINRDFVIALLQFSHGTHVVAIPEYNFVIELILFAQLIEISILATS